MRLLAYLSFTLSLPPVSQVLAVHNEAEKERTDAKMKIAKLEDALRYICLRSVFKFQQGGSRVGMADCHEVGAHYLSKTCSSKMSM